MTLIKQKISNHNLIPDVERFVEIKKFTVSESDKIIVIVAEISYKKNDEDVSASFQREIKKWVIDNSYLVQVRDATNLEPIPNPNYTPHTDENGDVFNADDEFLREPAYNYFKSLVFENGLNIKTAFQSYILLDDSKGAFNF